MGITFLSLLLAANQPMIEPATIERSIVAARTAVHVGSFAIHSRHQHLPNQPVESAYRVWMDGERFRFDQVKPFPPTFQPTRFVTCWNCEGKGKYTSFMDRISDGKQMGVSCTEITPDIQSRNPRLISVVNPKGFGLIPTSLLGYCEYTSFDVLVTRPGRKYLPVAEEMFSGKRCYRLEYTAGTIRVSYWVDAESTHVCYKIAQVFLNPSGDENLRGELTNTFANAELRRYGIPSQFELREVSRGRDFVERCDVHQASINRPLPASTFKVQGFDLPEGTPVVGIGDDNYVWTQGELVPLTNWQAKERVADLERTQRSWTRSSFIRLAIIIGSLSLLALAYFLFRRLSKARSSQDVTKP